MSVSGKGAAPFNSASWFKVRSLRRGLAGLVNYDPNSDDDAFKQDWMFGAPSGGGVSSADLASTGAATVSFVGQSIRAGVLSSAGVAAVSAVGRSTRSGALSSAGVAAVSAVGRATATGVLASAGQATVSAVGDTAGGSVASGDLSVTAGATAAFAGEAVQPESEMDMHDGFSPSEAKQLREYLNRRKHKQPPAKAAKAIAVPAPEAVQQTTEPVAPAEPASSPPPAPFPSNDYYQSILSEIERLNAALSDLSRRQIEAARRELEDLGRAHAAGLALEVLRAVQDDDDDEDDLMLLMSI